jgi:hypothetical protein
MNEQREREVMRLSRIAQIEAGEGRDCDQEVHFWFGERPIVG